MKRQTNIKGYTRKVNGKTVHVKPHTRMSGKDGAAKAGAGAELRAKKAEGGSTELLSKMYSLGAHGEVKELPFDRSEINYVGADAAEVGVNPTVKPGEMSASRKKWLSDLDRKLSPEERAKYYKKSADAPMSRKEFAESLSRAQASSNRGRKVSAPAPTTKPVKPSVSRTEKVARALDKIDSVLEKFLNGNTKKKKR